MRHDLRNALVRVIDYATSVNNKAEETKDNIAASQHTTNDISSAVYDIAEGATAMAQDVSQTSTITASIGDSVENVLYSANGHLDKSDYNVALERIQNVYDSAKEMYIKSGEYESNAVKKAEIDKLNYLVSFFLTVFDQAPVLYPAAIALTLTLTFLPFLNFLSVLISITNFPTFF